jgi:hypothetical protein
MLLALALGIGPLNVDEGDIRVRVVHDKVSGLHSSEKAKYKEWCMPLIW